MTPAQAKGEAEPVIVQEGGVREGFSEASVHLLEFGRLDQEPKPDEVSPSLLNQSLQEVRPGPGSVPEPESWGRARLGSRAALRFVPKHISPSL